MASSRRYLDFRRRLVGNDPQHCMQDHIYGEVCRGRPLALHIEPYRDVLRTLVGDIHETLALHTGPYGDVPWTLHFHVLGTSVGSFLGTSAGDVPWRYIEDHMGTSSGRNCAEWEVRVRHEMIYLTYSLFFLTFSYHFFSQLTKSL